MKTTKTKQRVGVMEKGFTLIELLVVIAIIAIIAAMVTGLSALASRKKHDAVVTAEKNALMLFISSYHSKTGFYPPDNANNVNWPPGSVQYERYTGQNPLLYELTGAPLLTNNNFLAFDGSTISGSIFGAAYGRGGIANSLPDETRSYYQPLPGPKDYMATNVNGVSLKQLVVPVSLTFAPRELNWWHYDCSNPNRHNSSGFDLWAEYNAGKDSSNNPIIITNGNW